MNSLKNIHFEISERKILLRVLDVLFPIFTFFLIAHFYTIDYFVMTLERPIALVVFSVYLILFGTVFEMYHLQNASLWLPITRSVILTTSVTVLFYLLTPFYTPVLPSNRLQILVFFFSVLFSLLSWRYLYIQFFASNRFVKKVLFIGLSSEMEVLVAELNKFNPHYKIMGFIAVDKAPMSCSIPFVAEAELEEFVRKNFISEIVVTHVKNKMTSPDLYNQLLCFLENGVVIRKYSQVYENSTYRLPIHFDDREFYKFFPFSRSNQNKLYLYFSRFFDIVFSVVGLFAFFTFAPFLWILNLLANRGSFFYTQERVGKNGVPFTIYKMRTMIPNAEQEGAVFAAFKDKRITPFGRFLRKTRLDELPQFINVLKGDMAIIGPRPERPVFVEQIAASIPLYQTRHVIKPGLTGWAQVNYPYGSSLEDSLMKLRYDLYYIKHRSLFLDLNIIVKTMSTVLFFRGQ